jgi:hypothetical protein
MTIQLHLTAGEFHAFREHALSHSTLPQNPFPMLCQLMHQFLDQPQGGRYHLGLLLAMDWNPCQMTDYLPYVDMALQMVVQDLEGQSRCRRPWNEKVISWRCYTKNSQTKAPLICSHNPMLQENQNVIACHELSVRKNRRIGRAAPADLFSFAGSSLSSILGINIITDCLRATGPVLSICAA